MSGTSSRPPAPIAVISPHLDDAVLSCGQLLAGQPDAVVVTAFAGRPERYPELTSWDERAGFKAGDDVVAARRREDRAALAVLGARPLWLGFPDTQYTDPPSCEALAAAIERALDEVGAELAVMPLGLFHSDHLLTHRACLEAFRRQRQRRWLLYAEAIYRRVPNLLDDRLAELERAGLCAQAVGNWTAGELVLKRQAVGCYGSQLRALARSWDGGYGDAFECVNPGFFDEPVSEPAPEFDLRDRL